MDLSKCPPDLGNSELCSPPPSAQHSDFTGVPALTSSSGCNGVLSVGRIRPLTEGSDSDQQAVRRINPNSRSVHSALIRSKLSLPMAYRRRISSIFRLHWRGTASSASSQPLPGLPTLAENRSDGHFQFIHHFADATTVAPCREKLMQQPPNVEF